MGGLPTGSIEVPLWTHDVVSARNGGGSSGVVGWRGGSSSRWGGGGGGCSDHGGEKKKATRRRKKPSRPQEEAGLPGARASISGGRSSGNDDGEDDRGSDGGSGIKLEADEGLMEEEDEEEEVEEQEQEQQKPKKGIKRVQVRKKKYHLFGAPLKAASPTSAARNEAGGSPGEGITHYGDISPTVAGGLGEVDGEDGGGILAEGEGEASDSAMATTVRFHEKRP